MARSASALLKSASSVRNQIATYDDSLMAYEYSNSAFTDSALSSYSAYLKSRIDSLSASGSVADASKALSLTKALDSAGKSNVSATIQRENIQVLSGNATLEDKYSVVAQQFVRAQANGDMTLAQTLEGQAYSISQSIQAQRQAASDASNTLAKANATSEGNIVTNLKEGLNQLNTTLEHTGQKDFNKVVNNWVASNKATFNALGVDIPTGSQPNYFNLVNGVMGAVYNHEMLAYQALNAINTPAAQQEAQMHKDAAMAFMNGGSTIKTLAGDMNAQQVQEAMANPSMYAYDQSTSRFVKTTQTGYQFNPANPINPQPTYSGQIKQTTFLSPDQTAQMTKLGLSFTENGSGANANTTGDGVRVQSSTSTPQWLKDVLGKNGVTNMFTTSNGGLQFQADSVSGQGKAVYTIAKDGTAWESSELGDKLLSGTPQSQQQPTSVFGRVGEAFMAGVKNVSTMLMGKAYADALPSSMLQQSTNHFTLPPIPIAKPVQLPTLTVAQPQAQPTITAKAAPVIAPATNPQQTVSPQTSAPSSVVQGGGISLQGGGGGRSISLQ